MELGVQLSSDQGPSTPNQLSKMRGVPYAEAVGSILWPAVVLRPDIAFVIGVLSQFIQNPGPAHWQALKRVIVYLGATKGLWLMFGRQTRPLCKGFATPIGQARSIDTQSPVIRITSAVELFPGAQKSN